MSPERATTKFSPAKPLPKEAAGAFREGFCKCLKGKEERHSVTGWRIGGRAVACRYAGNTLLDSASPSPLVSGMPMLETRSVDQPLAAGTRYFPVPAYDTPEQIRKPLFFRVCPFASVRFYGSMLYCVFWARRLARQGRFDQAALAGISSVTTRAVEWSGGRLHFRGLDELDKVPGAVVIVGNHMSSLETFMIPSLVVPSKPLGFVVKDSLARHPLFGPIMRNTRHIAVSRTNARRDLQTVLDGGTKLLQEGVSFCIFPQATRRFEFSEEHFNSLGVKLARRAGVPVVPLAVRSDFWGNGRIFKDVGRINPKSDVYLSFGPALPPTMPPQEVHQAVVRFVREHLRQWGVPCLTARGTQPEA